MSFLCLVGNEALAEKEYLDCWSISGLLKTSKHLNTKNKLLLFLLWKELILTYETKMILKIPLMNKVEKSYGKNIIHQNASKFKKATKSVKRIASSQAECCISLKIMTPSGGTCDSFLEWWGLGMRLTRRRVTWEFGSTAQSLRQGEREVMSSMYHLCC